MKYYLINLLFKIKYLKINNTYQTKLIMFTNKQLIRNYIFGVFCIMILIISFMLTYYVTFFNEELKLEKQDLNEINNETENCISSLTSFKFALLKVIGAFFAGGIIADGIFIKFGII